MTDLHKVLTLAANAADETAEGFGGLHYIGWQKYAAALRRAASGIEAASAGETGTGSTEGESPTAEGGDAQNASKDPQ